MPRIALMLIEIYADIVCPWCYVGERRFARALAELEDDDAIEVAFRPFQLDPGAPEEPEPLTEYLTHRYGDQARAMQERVGAVARDEGITIDWDRALAANTRHAHRLAGFVERERGTEAQRALVERLYDLHFTRGGDLMAFDQLSAEAAAVGMDAERVRSFLESGEGTPELEVELRRARELGIRAVPTFVFEGKWAVEGAQPTETFVNAIQEVASATEP